MKKKRGQDLFAFIGYKKQPISNKLTFKTNKLKKYKN